jgi:hypothetical protein
MREFAPQLVAHEGGEPVIVALVTGEDIDPVDDGDDALFLQAAQDPKQRQVAP